MMGEMNANDLNEQLVDYLYGELDDERRSAFEAALRRHPEIQLELDALSRVRSVFKSMDRLDPPPNVTHRLLEEGAVRAPGRVPRGWVVRLRQLLQWLVTRPVVPAVAMLVLVMGVSLYAYYHSAPTELAETRRFDDSEAPAGEPSSREQPSAEPPQGRARRTANEEVSSEQARKTAAQAKSMTASEGALARPGRSVKPSRLSSVDRRTAPSPQGKRGVGLAPTDQNTGRNTDQKAFRGPSAIGQSEILNESAPKVGTLRDEGKNDTRRAKRIVSKSSPVKTSVMTTRALDEKLDEELAVAREIREVVRQFFRASPEKVRSHIPRDWVSKLPLEVGEAGAEGGLHIGVWRVDLQGDHAQLDYYPQGAITPRDRRWFRIKLMRKADRWEILPPGVAFVHAWAKTR